MVRVFILTLMLFVNPFVNAQTDTLDCDKSFKYYDNLLGENLIVVWDTPPSIKKCSQKNVRALKELVKKHTHYSCVIVEMIINHRGKPICFRFKPKLREKIKEIFIEELKKLDFKPAKQGEKEIESIYMFRI